MLQGSTTGDSRRSRGRSVLVLGVLVVGVLAVVLGGLSLASEPAEARFPINNFTAIDDTATLTPSGHNVHVTGTTNCTAGEIVEVNVTVRQNGVEATGQTRERCLGEDTVQQWSIHATTRGPASFEEGDAHVWAEARTYDRGTVTDEHDWDSDVDLVGR